MAVRENAAGPAAFAGSGGGYRKTNDGRWHFEERNSQEPVAWVAAVYVGTRSFAGIKGRSVAAEYEGNAGCRCVRRANGAGQRRCVQRRHGR